MVLNHFKSPEKPGKSEFVRASSNRLSVMEPGVLRQLLEESNKTPQETHQTDTLGFYLKNKAETKEANGDLLESAATFMEKANELVQAKNLVSFFPSIACF